MKAPHKLVPSLLLFAACAHCGSSSDPVRDASADADLALDGSAGGEKDAASGDAASDAASATLDARSDDAASQGEAGSPDAAAPLPAHTYVYVGGYSDSDPFR